MISALTAALSVALPQPFMVPPAQLIHVPAYDLWLQLDRVNLYVNEHCTYTEQGDENPWGRCGMKGWKGNCKDYALEKRAELLISGLDVKRMKIWSVMVYDKGQFFGHAVLVVDDKWVLDNNADIITTKAWGEARGYTYMCAIPDKNLYDGPTHNGGGDADPTRCNK